MERAMILSKNSNKMLTTKQLLELDAKRLLNRIRFHTTKGIHRDSDLVCVLVDCWQSEVDKSHNVIVSLLPLKHRGVKLGNLPISILGLTADRLYCFKAVTNNRGQATFSNLPEIHYLITTPDQIIESRVELEAPSPTHIPAVRTRGVVKVKGRARRWSKEFHSHDKSILCQLGEMETGDILMQFQTRNPDLERAILQYAFVDPSEKIVKVEVAGTYQELRGFIILCKQEEDSKIMAEITLKLNKPLLLSWNLVAFPVTLEQLGEYDVNALKSSLTIELKNERSRYAWKSLWDNADKSRIDFEIKNVFEKIFQ